MKYKYFVLRRSIILASFLFIVLSLFDSCAPTQKSVFTGATARGSIDFPNTKETGTSSINYKPRLGENIGLFTELWLKSSLPKSGKDDINDDIYNLRSDAYNLRSDALLQNPDAEQEDEKNIGIRGGIEYISKGAKFKTGGGSIGLNYLEVPIIPEYRFSAGPGNICAGVGPYFAYGIGGKSFGVSSFGENNGGYKRFDAGLSFLLDYKSDAGVAFGFSYDFGLANTIYPSQDVKSHNRCFSINLGYEVGRLLVKKQK